MVPKQDAGCIQTRRTMKHRSLPLLLSRVWAGSKEKWTEALKSEAWRGLENYIMITNPSEGGGRGDDTLTRHFSKHPTRILMEPGCQNEIFSCSLEGGLDI